jgi:hypothetical protein
VENNFKCSDCKSEFFVSQYSFTIKKEYFIPKTNQRVCCTQCASSNVTPIERQMDLSTILYGKFSSATDEEKKRMLKQRADAHMKKTEEQYRTIDKEFHGRVNEKHY